MALAQPGNILGETLISSEDPEEMLVISASTGEEHWNGWFQNEKRGEVQEEIDELLGRQTYYQVYYNV